MAGVEQDDADEQGQHLGVLFQERGAVGLGQGVRLGQGGLYRAALAEGEGKGQHERHGDHQDQGDDPGPQGSGQGPADGRGQGIGPAADAASQAEVQLDVIVEAVHAQGVDEGGEQLEQDQQDHVQRRLDGLSGDEEQAHAAEDHGGDGEGGELPQGEDLQVVPLGPDEGLEDRGGQTGYAQEQADLGVCEAPVQQVQAGERDEDTIGHPIASLDEGEMPGGAGEQVLHAVGPPWPVKESKASQAVGWVRRLIILQ